MKKLIIFSILLIMFISLFGVNYSSAVSSDAKNLDKANVLKELGLFMGTDKGFELEKETNRVQGAVMLVRLLGKENYAKEKNYSHPFIDVPKWASSYVGYMYKNGLTNGISKDKFGSNDKMSAFQYVTFVLRALGYSDKDGDFKWNEPFTKAEEISLLNEAEVSYIQSKGIFLRDDVVGISYNALKTKLKDKENSLAEKLIENNVFSREVALENEVISNKIIVKKPNTEGNSQGNIHVLGWVSMQDDWVYFANYGPGRFLYKMKADGSELTQIYNGGASCINVIGEYIYFLNDNYAGKIYKIKLDGSELEKVCDDEIANFMYIKDGWIYYSNKSDSEQEGNAVRGRLYKIKLDGSEKTKLTDIRISQSFSVGDEFIYLHGYSNEKKEVHYGDGSTKIENESALFRLDLDGDNLKKIGTYADTILEYKNEVYFLNLQGIYNIDKNGNKKKTLFKADEDQKPIRSLIIQDDYMYFKVNSASYDAPIYRMKLDGTGFECITEDKCYWWGVVGEWIYYVADYNSSSKFYKINVDGTGKQKFIDNEWITVE